MADINELKQKRAGLIAQARAIIDTAEKREDPSLTSEENTKWERIMVDVGKLSDQVKKEEDLRALEKEALETRTEPTKTTGKKEEKEPEEKRDVFYRDAEKAESIFERCIKAGNDYSSIAHELRALQVDSDAGGGYLVAPTQWMNKLLAAKDNLTFIRTLATKYTVKTAESLGFPSLDNDPADPAWTKEIAIGTEDSTMSFGKRELRPHPLAKYIYVSKTLIRKAMVGAEALVRDRLGYKFAVTEEAAFMTGNGAGQPLGLFTASSDGISTDRDVSTGNTSTAIRTDGLIEAKMSLKKQYRTNCAWVFHRDAIKMIMKLKDGNGNYIWQASITAGQPDRLLNFNIYESEYAPNTFTTGLYVGLLGDFSYYWIVDALDMTIQKLVELRAATNQDMFIGRAELDGMPVHQNAFARVKLG